ADAPATKAAPVHTDGVSLLNGNEDRTILYIEDIISNLTVVQQLLADQPNIKVITAMQGSLGIELARQHLPDLILLDLHLPDMHGAEGLSRLRADRKTSAIRVGVLSADAT